MPSCSKAPRGLSVLPRVTCIFTGTAVSPSLWPRQRPTRYAIRAGRNLPDKEFRYLRTVIVTAAVYRGFNSGLAALLLTFRHRAGVSPYTSPSGFAETCVFSKQSVGPLCCDSRRFGCESLHAGEHPFSRSYGVILPSSLARVLSSALVSSTRLPASVCGTGTCVLPRGFSRKHGISHFAPHGAPHRPWDWRPGGFAYRSSLHLWPGTSDRPVGLPSFVPPSVMTNARWCWNVNQLSIAYAFRPRLRPD